MHWIDHSIFYLYLLGLLAFGFYHFFKHKTGDDYFLGGRNFKARHIGFSIAATDVGGGFSIGLAGLGFTMGLSGSWLLFTGLVGAWISAVWLIPKIKFFEQQHHLSTYPELLKVRFGTKVAILAALISGIGYLGFTGAQILAGAKLATATLLPPAQADNELSLQFMLWLIGGVTIIYTVFGGLKAVIYTDSIQWAILLVGLSLFAMPYAIGAVGGWQGLVNALPESYFSLTNLSLSSAINWTLTITPIWLVAMTLYQRVFACKDTATAKRAWFLAGILEYPLMAFSGVILGMCARVLLPESDAEMAVPAMIRDLLPIGITGIIIAAYFSAIMSTADSCLMAASGHLTQDILKKNNTSKSIVKISMLATAVLGTIAIVLASQATQVLDAIIYAYGFMISGLVFPTIAALFLPNITANSALASMLSGVGVTTLLMSEPFSLPAPLQSLALEPSVYGLLTSGIVMLCAHYFTKTYVLPTKNPS